jgi:biopolymer transport protein ExbD
MEELAGALHRAAAMATQPELQFEPHPEARYGHVGEVLALIKRSNIGAMGMIGNERYGQF